MLLMCKRRYFVRLKILFLACRKYVSAISKKKKSLMTVALHRKSWMNTGALFRHVKLETQRETLDKLWICLVHAQHLKKPVPDEELWHLCCTSASHPCDCVQFVCVWMCVSVYLLVVALLCWVQLVYAVSCSNPLNAVVHAFDYMLVIVCVN